MSTAAVLSDFFTAALREARSERPASLASRIPALDELTEGGFPVNALTELFIPHAGIGEVRMLLPALASLKHVTWVLPCDSEAAPYAPALADAGLDLDRQLFSIPSTPEEAFWCAEQAAASGETSAVVVWLNPLVHGKDGAALARLDMAAHSTGTTIFLIRPSSMACWASMAAAAVSSILVCSSATSAVSCSYSLLIWAMRDSASSSVACAASTAA